MREAFEQREREVTASLAGLEREVGSELEREFYRRQAEALSRVAARRCANLPRSACYPKRWFTARSKGTIISKMRLPTCGDAIQEITTYAR